MSIKVSWLKKGSTFQRVEGDFSTIDQIPKGIYNIGLSMTGWYLEKYADTFIFDYKVYGLQDDFCDHVIKTYDNSTGNLGILLNGLKGTGKTVTAKVLANRLNLPVIIVKSMGDNNQALIEFLSSFNFDCVLFMDEFEKNFNDKDSSVLQIMDGVYNIGYRKVFLLTTNELRINENLIGRPSRIKYVRSFGNLELKIVEEFLDDALLVPEARQDVIDFIDTLEISTIDILKAVVNEVNIHGVEGFKKSREFFNVRTLTYDYWVTGCYIEHSEFKTYPDLYTVDKFLDEVKRDANPMLRPEFMFKRKEVDWTDAEREEAKVYYDYNKKNFRGFDFRTVSTHSKFQSIKVGDVWDGENVIFIDHKRRVIVAGREGGTIFYYYIKDPSAKPSLYNSYKYNNISKLL